MGLGMTSAERADHAARLMADGYVVVRRAIDPSLVEGLNADLDECFAATPFCEGDFYGAATKRFGSLLTRSSFADAFVLHPLALALAEHVLGPWCERIALNLTQATEIHPGALAQYPHRDEDMWGGPKGEMEYLINVIWPLGRFTAANGATRLWPKGVDAAGSGEGRAADGTALPDERKAVFADLEVGDALVFLGSTLHGGGANGSDWPRRGLIVSYCLGWLKPFENQWLVYPPHEAQTFSPELAALVGYVQHRPNLGNVEGQCPSRLLDGRPGGSGDAIAARDALREDQAVALEDYVARQKAEAAAARVGLLGG